MTGNVWPNKEEKTQNPHSWKRPFCFQEIPTAGGEYSIPWLTTVKRQTQNPVGKTLPWAHLISHLQSVLWLEQTFLLGLLFCCVVSVLEFFPVRMRLRASSDIFWMGWFEASGAQVSPVHLATVRTSNLQPVGQRTSWQPVHGNPCLKWVGEGSRVGVSP